MALTKLNAWPDSLKWIIDAMEPFENTQPDAGSLTTRAKIMPEMCFGVQLELDEITYQTLEQFKRQYGSQPFSIHRPDADIKTPVEFMRDSESQQLTPVVKQKTTELDAAGNAVTKFIVSIILRELPRPL
jgi:hypothetical protein